MHMSTRPVRSTSHQIQQQMRCSWYCAAHPSFPLSCTTNQIIKRPRAEAVQRPSLSPSLFQLRLLGQPLVRLALFHLVTGASSVARRPTNHAPQAHPESSLCIVAACSLQPSSLMHCHLCALVGPLQLLSTKHHHNIVPLFLLQQQRPVPLPPLLEP